MFLQLGGFKVFSNDWKVDLHANHKETFQLHVIAAHAHTHTHTHTECPKTRTLSAR